MKKALLVMLPVAALTLSACGSGGGMDSGGASNDAVVPSPRSGTTNNAQEVTSGKSMVATWNTTPPPRRRWRQEIPAGKSSEEVIGAAITAGNAPCLVLNTAPAAVPGFQKQGGLVALDDFPDGKQYLQSRVGDRLSQYASPDGKYYQMPWKSNPVMIFYNKELFKKAGLDAEHPKLASYQDFLNTSRKLVKSGVARLPSGPRRRPSSAGPGSTSTRCSPRKQVSSSSRTARPSSPRPRASRPPNCGRPCTTRAWLPKESFNGDSFAEGKASNVHRRSLGGLRLRRQGQVGRRAGADADGTAGKGTFSDEKSIGMYTS